MMTGSTRIVNARVLKNLSSQITMNCASTTPSDSCIAAGQHTTYWPSDSSISSMGSHPRLPVILCCQMK